MKLVVYGDINMDMAIVTDGVPRLGGDAVIRALSLLPGGSAANCAAVAARLGTPAEMAGAVGTDLIGRLLLDDLRACGVGVGHVRVEGESSGVVIALIGQGGERSFLSYRGANAAVAYGAPPPGLIAPGDLLHLSGYSFQDEHSRVAALAFMSAARSVGAQISLDPSFHFVGEIAEAGIFPLLDLIFPNLDEACRLTGAADPQGAAAALRAAGCQTVIVTLGADGCYIDSAAGQAAIPAYAPAQVVDTIGAGDAFCGGFLTGWLRGWSAADSARLGHAAAAGVLAAAGGRAGALAHDAMVAFLWKSGEGRLASALATPQAW
jgi:sugar/nucleoside kinase (ribokinase family)